MKEHVTCRIDKDTLKKARGIAKCENRSISNLIEVAVTAYVLKQKISK